MYTGIDSPVLAGAGAGAWCLTAWLIRLGEGAGTGAGKEDGIKRWEANVSTGAKIDPFKLSMRTPQTPSYLRLGERAGNISHLYYACDKNVGHYGTSGKKFATWRATLSLLTLAWAVVGGGVVVVVMVGRG